MFLKTVFFVIFVLLLGPSDVKSVNDSSQPGNSQDFEIQKIANHRRELENILKYLEENRKYEEVTRTRETPAQDQDQKQLRLNQQIELDKLELRIRQQIERLLNGYAHQQPTKVEYVLQLNKDIAEINKVIQRIKERRAQELRAHDLRQIQFNQQQINIRRGLEQKLSELEHIPNNPIGKRQRLDEQESFKSISKTLEDNLQRMKNWHTKNQPLSESYNLLTRVIEQNMNSYKIITSQIDQRRAQEVLMEKQQIAKLKEDLNTRKQYELEQRKKQIPLKNDMLLMQRKNDDLIEDTFDRELRLQISNIENRLAKNNFIDKDFAHLSGLLNSDLKKFEIHIRSVQQRRNQEQNMQVTQKGNGLKHNGVRFIGQTQSLSV